MFRNVSRIIAEHINAAALLKTGCGQTIHSFGRRYIASNKGSVTPGRSYFHFRLLSANRIYVRDQNLSAFIRKNFGNSPAYPMSRARDNRCFTLESHRWFTSGCPFRLTLARVIVVRARLATYSSSKSFPPKAIFVGLPSKMAQRSQANRVFSRLGS